MFCKNSQRLNTVNYFCKKLHLRCFTAFWIRLWLSSLNVSLCFFYYYFYFESMKFRSSRSQQLDSNNHLVHKQTLNHLAKLTSLAKWLSVHLWTKWMWVQVQLQSIKVTPPPPFPVSSNPHPHFSFCCLVLLVEWVIVPHFMHYFI